MPTQTCSRKQELTVRILLINIQTQGGAKITDGVLTIRQEFCGPLINTGLRIKATENIRVQQSLLVGHQLKPEQCSKRSGSQGQSEPLIFEGADHVASAVAPIKRAFNQKPTSADPLSTNRCHHQDASLSGAHLARRGSMSAPN